MNKNRRVDLPLTAAARRRAARQRTTLAALTSSLAAVSSAQAAGGHHAVDDAALLEPGQCQVETWFDHELGGERRLLHVGPGCRVGAVEFGLNFDRARPVSYTHLTLPTKRIV